MRLARNSLIAFGLLTSLESYSAEVKVGGDLRFRHEKKDVEDKVSRSRQRIRARINVSSQVNENLKLGMRMSTGGEATSGNQSFDGGFSPKGFNLALATSIIKEMASTSLVVKSKTHSSLLVVLI